MAVEKSVKASKNDPAVTKLAKQMAQCAKGSDFATSMLAIDMAFRNNAAQVLLGTQGSEALEANREQILNLLENIKQFIVEFDPKKFRELLSMLSDEKEQRH